MKKTLKVVLMFAMAVLVVACNKPEKDELAGTWRWTSTTGGIAGVNYTPESEGFNAEIVFKSGRFTFYKDGRKVTSGPYQVAYDVDKMKGDEKGPSYIWFSLHFHEAQCRAISKATDGIISINPDNSATIAIYDDQTERQVLSFGSSHLSDRFYYSFEKE